MKIVLTGGGTGGHFYPIIAVAEALRATDQNPDLQIYYIATEKYDATLLENNKLIFIKESAGKLRRYFSFKNLIDPFKTIWGIIKMLWVLYWIMPDVIFGKGGYVSFPVLLAGRFYRIPIIIHESDSVPGALNRWAGKFATRVAISYPKAAEYFPKAREKNRIAQTGQPIRKEIIDQRPEVEKTADITAAYEHFKLDPNIPTIIILGGSQGAQIINETILTILPTLVEKYQCIHQVGETHLPEVSSRAHFLLEQTSFENRYRPLASLNANELRLASDIAKLVISRSGSTIFEIAVWGIPAILIPITKSNGNHQRQNAYNYARTGAAIVIEETNLIEHIVMSEIDQLLGDQTKLTSMSQAAKKFAHTDAAALIAQEIIRIAQSH